MRSPYSTNVPALGALTLLALHATLASGVPSAPDLSIAPNTGLMDAPFHVLLRNVLPGSRVELTASRPNAKGRAWTAVGEYLADAQGRVDVDVSPSLGGSYQGISPHGLWCSALPVAPGKLDAYIADLPQHPELGTSPRRDVGATTTVMLKASIGGKIVATAQAARTYAGVAPQPVTAGGDVRGMFFPAASGATKGMPVVVLAGSEGGLSQAQAALLASHGHPALALGLFGYRDLPAALLNIPLETVRDGARWLKHETGASRVAIMGTSRGSEAAGLAASYFPKDFAAAILYVPSHLSNAAFGPGVKGLEPAWTLAGRPLPAAPEDRYAPAARAAMLSKPPGLSGTPGSLRPWNDAGISATMGIPFERMQGPLLVIAAGADELWPSFIAAAQIRRRLAAHGESGLAEIHVYPGAGHLISRVGIGGPMSSYVVFDGKMFLDTGGLPNANCESSYDAWSKVLRFLRRVGPAPAAGSTPDP